MTKIHQGLPDFSINSALFDEKKIFILIEFFCHYTLCILQKLYKFFYMKDVGKNEKFYQFENELVLTDN